MPTGHYYNTAVWRLAAKTEGRKQSTQLAASGSCSALPRLWFCLVVCTHAYHHVKYPLYSVYVILVSFYDLTYNYSSCIYFLPSHLGSSGLAFFQSAKSLWLFFPRSSEPPSSSGVVELDAWTPSLP